MSGPTLDTLCISYVSPTGILPSASGLSSPLRLHISCAISVLNPTQKRGLGSFPFARRYLGNRCFFLLLRVLRCFSSPGFPLYDYFIHHRIPMHYHRCVPAFGNLRIIGYLLLPAAYRSLSRPSSAPSAKASALCSLLLDLLLVFCSLHCVAARSFVGYIPKYAPSALPRAPCESRKILRNLHCRFLFKTNIFQIPTLALCVGFLYYCFTRSENFLVFSVNLRNCILTLHFS